MSYPPYPPGAGAPGYPPGPGSAPYPSQPPSQPVRGDKINLLTQVFPVRFAHVCAWASVADTDVWFVLVAGHKPVVPRQVVSVRVICCLDVRLAIFASRSRSLRKISTCFCNRQYNKGQDVLV